MPIDRLRPRVALLAALSLVLLLGATVPVGAQTRTVSMVDDKFKPAAITISVGDSVRWVNNGKAAHTATSRVNGLFDSSLVPSGDSFTHKFSKAGTYRYYCFLHAGMNGTVVVRSAPKPTTNPPRPRPTPRAGGGTSGGQQPPTDTAAVATDEGGAAPAEPWLVLLLGFAALGALAATHRRLAGVRAARR